MSSLQLKRDLQKLADPAKVKLLQGFFKTGKGQYGEGDIFLGIMVPQSRMIAKKYEMLPLHDIEKLLKSKVHEVRLISLLILVRQFEQGNETKQKKIYQFYIREAKRVNNWDLVDLSAQKIVGHYLFDHPEETDILTSFAGSKNIWERRISVISTFWFIQYGQFDLSLQIASRLLDDSHDLIHKAVGWMLREVGKKSIGTEKDFLKKHYRKMPRTMLRYAIERFPETERKKYLHGLIK